MNILSRNWWTLKGEDLQRAILESVISIRQNRLAWETDCLNNLKLATNRYHGNLFDVSQQELMMDPQQLKWNIIGSIIETCESEVAGTTEPRAKFTTKGGRYRDRLKGEKLTQFCDGVYYLQHAYALGREWLRDAALFGDGWIAIVEKETEEGTSVNLERTFPWYVLFDDRDAEGRAPRSMFRYFEIDREEALERFAGTRAKQAIKDAKKIFSDGQVGQTIIDPVGFIEAWHLPTYAGADNGLNVVICDSGIISEDDWTEQTFPLVPLFWTKPTRGMRGLGIGERVGPVQLELNLLLAKIQRHTNAAATKIYCNTATKINENTLNNDEFAVVEYTGDQPPIVVNQTPIHAQYYEQVDRLFARGFELAGLSQLRATSARSEVAGLRSGAAIREYAGIQSTRLQAISLDYVEAHLSVCREICRAARRIADRGDEVVVRYPLGDELEEISWSEVALDEDAYVIQAWPVPLLTGSPSFQLQAILELSEVNQEIANQLLENFDHPDMRGIMRGVNVRRKIVERVIGRILNGDTVDPPDPAIVTPETLEQMTAAYLDAQLIDEEVEILEAFRAWLAQAKVLLTPPPSMPLMGGMSGAMPAGQPPAPGAMGPEAMGPGA